MNFQIALSHSKKRLNDKKVQHLNIILKQKIFKVSDEMWKNGNGVWWFKDTAINRMCFSHIILVLKSKQCFL